MPYTKTALERAFEIARSGGQQSMRELKRVLNKEGYDAQQIAGASLERQLREMIRSGAQVRVKETNPLRQYRAG